ncbi:hypothetical protein COU60_05115 [Candidatus Pacearchaeota archaeon CG10_big_fil_rev_8_21_14_0_10_34_76]|nr:MAG: hypothetical protein COU60_05115 [Candidatus Pacearchaeota archaeon CG10_big_fil_rev_8_21_14_0_10_34_76]
MKKSVIAGIVIVAVLFFGIILFTISKDLFITSNEGIPDIDGEDNEIGNTDGGIQEIETEEGTGIDESTLHYIEITESGFLPQIITINKGDTVTWTNSISSKSWPASAVHPSHKVYPGSDISKCGTSEQDSIFDSCKGLSQEESYSFTFNEIGSWSYHDHLKSSIRGTIIVQ